MVKALLTSVILAGHAWVIAKGGLALCTPSDKAAKATICAMDHALVRAGADGSAYDYSTWSKTMEEFCDEELIYTPMYGINETKGLKDWFYGEHSAWFRAMPKGVFNQMLFLGDDGNASSMTYGLGVWKGHLGPLPPTHKKTRVRIMDAYNVVNKKITHNWMMMDLLDLMRQSGVHPLPVSPLPQGRDYPPRAMEGIPAPISSYVDDAETEASIHVVRAQLAAEWAGDSEDMAHWTEDMVWYGPVPFGMAQGKAEYKAFFLQLLHDAFADREVSLDMMTCEGKFCAAHGTFSGVHVGTWLGHEATQQRLQLNFGMHWHVEGKHILESWAIFDLPRMFLQLGVDLLKQGSPVDTLDTVLIRKKPGSEGFSVSESQRKIFT